MAEFGERGARRAGVEAAFDVAEGLPVSYQYQPPAHDRPCHSAVNHSAASRDASDGGTDPAAAPVGQDPR